ncbi:hypothetical protein [Salinisphaera sp. G21_0]|uniref:hypothetical protein n=1 Tax=Salinisphaera sp. G21_0 TaxID=2821094 RepID=UPI001ADC833B|nr:hypothetical protein [Salinisphaera sp. G21_0]MBO9483041.1 hypothetical protein [Salinisphaera sp. G21_0]
MAKNTNAGKAWTGKALKKAAVNEALAEFIRLRKQLELLDDFGTIDYHDDQAPTKEVRRK